jgi:putative effector of murein hydrolase LrgA (UPF0299 family)
LPDLGAVVGFSRGYATSVAADTFGYLGSGSRVSWVWLALILLATGRISLFTLRRGAEWFAGDMMLFFVPAVVSILDQPEFIGRVGLELLAVIVLSMLAVMTVTALTVERLWRIRFELT